MQDKFIQLNHLRFHYLEWGEASAPPLVLLHGITSSAHGWDKFAAAMQDRFHIFALDQRGHGETEWASDYSIERFVQDTDEFARALKIAPFALLGLSMGGRNAYAYVGNFPETVARLVIVDIGPEVDMRGGERIRASMLASDVFDDPAELFQRMRAANPRPADEDLRQRVMNSVMQRADGKWTWRYDKSLRDPDRPNPRPDPAKSWAWLTKITCPTLVVRGAESDLLSRATAERMTREISNCKLVEVANAGHTVPLDNPRGFLDAVMPFLLNE